MKSEDRLETVAQALVDGLLQIEATECYGPDGRETTGANMMASLARALVAVEAEKRISAKGVEKEAPPAAKLVPLPSIPRVKKP